MELNDIFSLEGIKLLDENIFHGRVNLILHLYSCKHTTEISLEKLLEHIGQIENGLIYLTKDDVFSIEEVAKEMEEFLLRLNNTIKFHYQHKRGYITPKGSYDIRNRKRRINEFVRKRKSLILEDRDSENKVIYLNKLCQETFKLIKKIREKNIVNTFSPQERIIYENLIEYFKYISKNHSSSKDFLSSPLKSKHPCNFYTDEKLVSAAFTLSHKNRVIILSSDTDLIKLIDFYDTEKRTFNLQDPNHDISLYSDFGEGFELRSYRKTNIDSNQYPKTNTTEILHTN